MQINKINNYNNPNFGAIFKLTRLPETMSETIIESVCESTVPEEAEKIRTKFQIGGGSLYVYVPNENLEKLQKLLQRRIVRESVPKYLTRID